VPGDEAGDRGHKLGVDPHVEVVAAALVTFGAARETDTFSAGADASAVNSASTNRVADGSSAWKSTKRRRLMRWPGDRPHGEKMPTPNGSSCVSSTAKAESGCRRGTTSTIQVGTLSRART
jgi:hypothetical protein